MYDKPIVSVIVPAFNRALALTSAVESVLRQSFQKLEIIVVDDGSRDATEETVLRMARFEPRIRLIRHESNRGAQAARNTGIRAALGEWIAFLDSDDTWVSNSLEARMAIARSRNVQVVHSPGFVLRFGGSERELFDVPALSGKVYRQVAAGAGTAVPGLVGESEGI